MTVPQIGAMYKGDRSRKETLVEYGFRLPSALDNRPLRFDEWESLAPQMILVSATPALMRKKCPVNRRAGSQAHWSSRPKVDIRPATSQVDDLLARSGRSS